MSEDDWAHAAAARPARITTYKTRCAGDLDAAAVAEMRQGHRLGNHHTEIWKRFEAEKAAAWAEIPEVAAAAAALAAAETAVEAAVKAASASRQRHRSRAAGAQEAAALADAKAAAKAAKAVMKDLKARLYPQAKADIAAAARRRDEAYTEAYAQYTGEGVYWGTVNDVTAHHKAAADRVRKLRKRDKAADLRYRRWAGEGTLTVQLQRENGGCVTVTLPAVPADPDAGMGEIPVPSRIAPAAAARWVTVKTAWRKPDPEQHWPGGWAWEIRNTGPEAVTVTWEADLAGAAEAADLAGAASWAADRKDAAQAERRGLAVPGGTAPVRAGRVSWRGELRGGDPLRTPAALADPAGKWAGQILFAPSYAADPAGYEAAPRAARRRMARSARLEFRRGQGHAAARETMAAVAHRVMDPDADITMVRVTRRMRGPDPVVHATMPAILPPVPQRPEGPVVCVHLGWRAMDDGSLRVAVISGAGPVPAQLQARGRYEGVITDRGTWQEVRVPAPWRGRAQEIEKLHGERDAAFAAACWRLAAWLRALPPGAADGEDPDDGPRLPAAAEVDRWRSPGRLAGVTRRLLAGDLPVPLGTPGAAELAADLGAWLEQDRRAWRRETRLRDRLLGCRDEAWRIVAAWVTRDAAVVAVDEWEMQEMARAGGKDEADRDAVQEEAARANRVLAAPGTLRAAIVGPPDAVAKGVPQGAAGARGVRVVAPETGPQVHHGCGGVLDPEQRRRLAVVTCEAGHRVDQDVNMLELMVAAMR